MRLIYSLNKGVLYGLVLILVILLVVLTKIAFTTTDKLSTKTAAPTPTPKVTDLCKPFSLMNLPAKINCQKAADTALADTPGKVVNIIFGSLKLEPVLIKTLERQKITIPKSLAWIIDIKLDKPFTLKNGKEVKFQQIQIPADGTRAIYRSPITL